MLCVVCTGRAEDSAVCTGRAEDSAVCSVYW